MLCLNYFILYNKKGKLRNKQFSRQLSHGVYASSPSLASWHRLTALLLLLHTSIRTTPTLHFISCTLSLSANKNPRISNPIPKIKYPRKGRETISNQNHIMSSDAPKNPKSLYPEVILTNPDATSPFISNTGKNPSSSSLYPSIEMHDLAENLFPETEEEDLSMNRGGNASFESSEEVVIKIPGAIVHLIDKDRSIELANGDFSVVQLKQGGNVVAALARVGEEIQWPLAKDESAVKLDDSHYFFSLRVPSDGGEISSDGILNYGLTIAAKGQEGLMRQLDSVLDKFSAFRVEKAAAVVEQGWWGAVAKGVSPAEMERKKEEVENSATAYWTTLAPNVEDYSSSVARLIAAGSGQVIRGILWCGDVTVDRLKWGDEFLKKRVGKGSSSDVSPEALRRMKRYTCDYVSNFVD